MMEKNNLLAYAFALLLLLSHCAHAADIFNLDKLLPQSQVLKCESSATADNESKWGNSLGFIALCAVALLIGISAAAVGKVLTGVLNTEKQTNWVRELLWSVLEGVVILSLFTASFVGFKEFGEANIDTARAYSTLIKGTAMFDFGIVIAASSTFSFFSKQVIQQRLGGNNPAGVGRMLDFYVSFQTGPMFRAGFDALNMTSQLIIVSIVEWTAHEFLMCFIKTNMLSLVIPAGIFLRAYGIKGGANALLGIGVALYFVYPFMLMMNGDALTDYLMIELGKLNVQKHPWMGCPTDRVVCCLFFGDAQPATLKEAFIKSGPDWNSPSESIALKNRISQKAILEGDVVLDFGANNNQQVPHKQFCIYNTGFARTYAKFAEIVQGTGIGGMLAVGGGAFALNVLADYYNKSWLSVLLIPLLTVFALSSVHEAVFFVFVVSMVLPIFSIFVTITFAKEIASALGTQIDLSSLEKII